jgi:hypothetical protein
LSFSLYSFYVGMLENSSALNKFHIAKLEQILLSVKSFCLLYWLNID